MADKESLIRVGKVSSIDADNRKARVMFPGMGNMVSDWLPVLWYPGFTNTSNGSHDHTVSIPSQSGKTSDDGTPIHHHDWSWVGGSADTDQQGYHTHEINQWMPRVNDRVLVLMEYGFNAAGYIVGVIP